MLEYDHQILTISRKPNVPLKNDVKLSRKYGSMEVECKYCKSKIVELSIFNKPLVQENLFKYANPAFQANKSYYASKKDDINLITSFLHHHFMYQCVYCDKINDIIIPHLNLTNEQQKQQLAQLQQLKSLTHH